MILFLNLTIDACSKYVFIVFWPIELYILQFRHNITISNIILPILNQLYCGLHTCTYPSCNKFLSKPEYFTLS